MDYDLSRVDYLICGVTYPDTLKTISSLGSKVRQKFTVGDKNGILQCLSIKDEEPYVHFKTLPGKPITSVQVAGSLDAQAEKIFAAAGNEIKGYTKKGKVFLTLETTLSETITSMYVLGGDLILGSGRSVTHYRELREVHSYACDDRVLDLVAFHIPNGSRLRILVLTANKGISLLENGQTLSKICIAAGPTRIILPPAQHNIYSFYGATDGSLGILIQNGSELSSKCLMEGHDLGAVVCAGWWLSNIGAHLAVGRHDGSIQLYLMDLENLMGKPRLKFTYFCGEPVTSVCGGFVGTEEGELLVATFSGRVFTLRSQHSMPVSAGPGGVAVTPRDALAARRTKLEIEILKLEKQVANERERYQRNTRSLETVLSQPPLLDIECKLTGGNQHGWQEIQIISAVVLDMLFFYCATKLELQSDTSAVLSLCYSQDDTADLLATARCQAGTRHLNVRVRRLKHVEYEGAEALRLLLYALPAGAPRVARLITLLLPTLPLYSQHEDPEVAEEQNRIWCLLRVSGGFSVAEVTSWLTNVLPQELPRPATTIVFARIHALLGTMLICRYQRGSAIFKSDNVSTIAALKDVISQCSFSKGIRVDFSVDIPKNTVLFSFNRIEEQFLRKYQKKKELELLTSLSYLTTEGTVSMTMDKIKKYFENGTIPMWINLESKSLPRQYKFSALDLDSTLTEEIYPHLCEEYRKVWAMGDDSEENFIELVDIVVQWYTDYGVLSLHNSINETEKAELRSILQDCKLEKIKEIIHF